MTVNWLAVIVAALSGFIVGGLWYGPLFGRAWQHASGVSTEALAGRHMAQVFGISFGLLLVAAGMLAFFIGPGQPVSFGLMAGAAAGVGWVATALGVVSLFEARPFAHWLVNAGYFIVTLTLMGGILAAWP